MLSQHLFLSSVSGVFFSQQSYVTVGSEKEEKTEDVPAKQDPGSKQVSVRVHACACVSVCASVLSFCVPCDCDVDRAF